MNSWDKFRKAAGTQAERFGRDFKKNAEDTWKGLTFYETRKALGLVESEDSSSNSALNNAVAEAGQNDVLNDGVITIYGLNVVTLQVGDSCIVLDTDIYIGSNALTGLDISRGHMKLFRKNIRISGQWH